jgi:membrane-bound metal-dependent hydrolase YbcI (DUF457 family)
MGRTHAASGGLAFAASAPLLSGLGVDLSPVGLAVGVVAAAGAALLPDLDHPSSTVARSLGPLSGALARVVAAISGGHRQGTHSLVGVASFTVLALLADQAGTSGRTVVAVLLLVLASAGLHLRLSRAPVLHLAVCALLGFVIVAACPEVSDAAHLLGDALTREGIPVLWPFRHDRVRLATLTTGGLTERLLIGPAMLVAAVVLTWHLTGGAAATDLYGVVVHTMSGA